MTELTSEGPPDPVRNWCEGDPGRPTSPSQPVRRSSLDVGSSSDLVRRPSGKNEPSFSLGTNGPWESQAPISTRCARPLGPPDTHSHPVRTALRAPGTPFAPGADGAQEIRPPLRTRCEQGIWATLDRQFMACQLIQERNNMNPSSSGRLISFSTGLFLLCSTAFAQSSLFTALGTNNPSGLPDGVDGRARSLRS